MGNKILLFSGNFLPKIGGAELVIYNIAKRLKSKGYDVLVLCGGWGKDNKIMLKMFDTNFKVVRYPYGYKGAGKLKLNIIISYAFLLYFILFKKYKIVHTHWAYHPGYVCALLKKVINFKYLLTLHGGDDFQECPEINLGITLNNPKMKKKVEFAITNADYVSAISKSIYYDLCKIEGIKEECLCDVPNGFDPSLFNTIHASENIRDVLNMESNTKVLITVGRQSAQKNYKYSINAMNELRKLCDDEFWKKIKLVIIGKDTRFNEAMVKELDLENNIVFVDKTQQDQLSDFYKTSDLFLLSSIIEGFGIVTVEAMACGLPVIVTDVPGSRDIVNEHVGFKVDINNPKEMAEKIFYLLNNKVERDNMSKSAICEAGKYVWDDIINKYESLYEKLV